MNEAQAVVDDLNQIKVHVEDAFRAAKELAVDLPYRIRHELDEIQRRCNMRILEMHSRFHNGRKRRK